jgi:hypothetical protein
MTEMDATIESILEVIQRITDDLEYQKESREWTMAIIEYYA